MVKKQNMIENQEKRDKKGATGHSYIDINRHGLYRNYN